MIDLDDFNEDINFNYTAVEVLREYAPHILHDIQNQFLDMHVNEGSVKIEPHTGNLHWVED